MDKTTKVGFDAVRERFSRYIAVDTRSDPQKSSETPSSAGQFKLAGLLYQELQDMGLQAYLDQEHAYTYGRLPGNKAGVPAIGFLAHLDTAPDMAGVTTEPQIFIYEGGDIRLNDEFSIEVDSFPFLKDLVGEEIICSNGTALLGADNKAGIVAIMEALAYLIAHPEIEHGDIAVAFTPDEEIGHGASLLDLDRFNAEFAYTMDGGPIGDFNFETFNAASAKIKIQGRNVHPGTAKHTMIHAGLIGMELHSLLPVGERPEWTEGHDGFYLLTDFNGTVEEASLEYIIRDHDRNLFREKKKLLQEIVDFLNKKYGQRINLEIEDSYYNMLDLMQESGHVIDLARNAMKDLDIEIVEAPIRGGTDGAQLTYRGLPCPNIFVGGYNYHGRYELVLTRGMALAADLIVKIAELNAGQ
ncbi:MAG: peptidase T [Clostridiaceae bacterium]|jgi:tripeptide aminopeptidase|nr:peptidase T [Clostridiaceae bacterium]